MKIRKMICLFLLIVVSNFVLASCTQLRKPETGDVPQSIKSRYTRGHNIPGKLYWAGSVQDKKVALTFDDGPEEHWTLAILDILKEKKVKATFFVVGEQGQKYPDMLTRMDNEGHIIGSHTFTHANLTKLDQTHIEEEIDKCTQVVRQIIGKTPRLIRPPFGFHNEAVDQVVYGKGDFIILWSLDTHDWQGLDTETIKARILPKMQNGYIILQHDGENPKLTGSVQALPDIIDTLQAQGYQFVTVPELLELEPYQS